MKKDKSGYVYILSNPCFPYLKIGHTKNRPMNRCQQLSRSQAIPKPFKLEFSAKVDNRYRVEKALHKYFENKKIGKEFFDIPISSAKNVIENLFGGIDYKKKIEKELSSALEKRRKV